MYNPFSESSMRAELANVNSSISSIDSDIAKLEGARRDFKTAFKGLCDYNDKVTALDGNLPHSQFQGKRRRLYDSCIESLDRSLTVEYHGHDKNDTAIYDLILEKQQSKASMNFYRAIVNANIALKQYTK